jgi:SAM-dependent methyltransferase
MAPSKHERQTRSDFSERFSVPASSVLDDIERDVIGDAWGATGFTTVGQAHLLGDRLHLERGRRLLDIGTGRGWPGVYLAKRSGCEVVLADLPIEGLEIAMRRAGRERVESVGGVVCSARYLPFAPASFDAAVHTDVVC